MLVYWYKMDNMKQTGVVPVCACVCVCVCVCVLAGVESVHLYFSAMAIV